MRWIIILFFSILCLSTNAQSISDIKHIEIVSEIQDSMVLLNKVDVDKINKVFFEKKKLDSLKNLNIKLIETLKVKNSKLDSIVLNQRVIIQNEVKIRNHLEVMYKDDLDLYKSKLKKEKVKKICWQTTTGICIITILIILL